MTFILSPRFGLPVQKEVSQGDSNCPSRETSF